MATITDLPQMWFGTSANYEALKTKLDGAIYFLSDTRQIARGSVKYSQEAQIVSALPGSGIRGYIYFNTTNGIAYIYNGSEFKAIGVVTISDISAAEDADVPNVGAVKNYVATQVAAGVANKVDKVAGKQLSTEDYTTAEKTKLGTYPENYSTVTALIDAKADPSDITDALNNYYTKGDVDGMVASVFTYKGTKATEGELPQDDQKVGDVWHVTAGSKEFAWDGTQWEELGGVVDLSNYYTKEEADSAIDTKVNAAKSELQSAIDEKADSTTVTALDGRVAAVESGKAAKVSGATQDNLAKLTAEGDLADSGVKVGGATLNGSPNAVTLATEAGVKAYADNAIAVSAATKVDKVVGTAQNIVVFGADGAIADSSVAVSVIASNTAAIATKVAKVTGAVENNVVVFGTAGEVKDTGYKLGGNSFAASNNNVTLATEAGVKAYVADMTVQGGATKMNFVDTSAANQIIIADTDGDAKASGVKIGGATFSENAAGTTVALEQAIIDLLAWKAIPEA